LEGAESLLLTPKASNKKPTLAFDSSTTYTKSNTTTKKTKAQPITNTNSDKLCASKNFISRKFYQLSLHNGLYMLNRNEQLALTAAGGIFTILALLYLSVFVRGFVDGMQVPPQQLQQQQQLSPQQTQQLSDSGNGLFAQLYHHHANGAGPEPTMSEATSAAATTATSSMGNAIAVEEPGASSDSATESASSSSFEKTTTPAAPTTHDGSGNSHSPVQQGVAEAVAAKATAGSGIVTEL
jgi:hypothetical protein